MCYGSAAVGDVFTSVLCSLVLLVRYEERTTLSTRVGCTWQYVAFLQVDGTFVILLSVP